MNLFSYHVGLELVGDVGLSLSSLGGSLTSDSCEAVHREEINLFTVVCFIVVKMIGVPFSSRLDDTCKLRHYGDVRGHKMYDYFLYDLCMYNY